MTQPSKDIRWNVQFGVVGTEAEIDSARIGLKSLVDSIRDRNIKVDLITSLGVSHRSIAPSDEDVPISPHDAFEDAPKKRRAASKIPIPMAKPTRTRRRKEGA